jgi:hypothetical protein
MFRQLIHEFTGYKDNTMVFLAPLPCHVEAGCCEDADLVSNRLQPDYFKKMEEGVFTARQNIKNFAFQMNISNCHTISTWGKLRKMEKLWTGPTSIQEEAYPVLAEADLEAMELAKKKRPGDNLEDEREKKRPQGQHTGSIHSADLGGQHTRGTPVLASEAKGEEVEDTHGRMETLYSSIPDVHTVLCQEQTPEDEEDKARDESTGGLEANPLVEEASPA